MAQKATLVHKKHAASLRLSKAEVLAMCDAARFVSDVQASMKLAGNKFPSIIIAGSGMATGGRILHHLKAFGGDHRNHIVFPGFQVPGTRGAKLVAGDRLCKIHGEYVRINADITQLEGLSGHADADGLVAWARQMPKAPDKTFVVHGERDAADTLRSRLADELGWEVSTSEHLSTHWA
jgi:metallo-beta-lactamase family protein